MHTDALAARRTAPGAVVVYGMHMLLWALECLASEGLLRGGDVRLRIDFLKWIYLGEEVELWFVPGQDGAPDRLQVRVADVQAIAIRLLSADAGEDHKRAVEPIVQKKRTCSRELAMEELEAQAGAFAPPDDAISAAMFPSLAATLGPRFAAEIATCSYVVGMETPGLYSIDSQADLHLHVAPATIEERTMSYVLESVDARFRRAVLRVRGHVVSGVLRAFVRNPPIQQASMAEVAKHVVSGEFHDIRALVVGGSRGLGEAAAKCIAAGGGRCVLTYAVGQQDAAAVVHQIVETGGEAVAVRYDVREPAAPQVAALPGEFTHLLYFATGPMFRGRSGALSASRLAEFQQFYVHGFRDLCAAMVAERRAASGAGLTVFYPSPESLEKPGAGLEEFAAARLAGEQLCRDLESELPSLRVMTARLPRLLTDQTASLVPERLPDTLATLLLMLRELNASR